MSGIEILLNDNRGIYIPQHFAEILRSGGGISWKGYSEEDLRTLEAGPDNEWYWEAWTAVLDNTTFEDSKGNIWHLYQDGDLFLYCKEMMTDKEYEGFFGEARQ